MNTVVRNASVAIAGLALGVTNASSQPGRAACERLTELKLPHVEVGRALVDTSGVTQQVSGLPHYCLVGAEARPTAQSSIEFEVWLPMENWNGKFSGIGNGGWAGGISRVGAGQGGGLAEQIKRGYASASSNTGHRAVNGFDAARFAWEYPERYIDFSYRAQHEMTVAAKAIVTAFYGKPPVHSYYIGFSSGGYQGLSEAQRYPLDYDGIVAGAPANNWTRLMASDMNNVIAVARDSASNLPPSALAILYGAALSACDASDGVADSVITDPRLCSFDPARVQCSASSPSSPCLTREQVAAAKAVYAGLKDPKTGASLYPGLFPGSEPYWTPFNPTSPFSIPISHFKWLVFADSTWDWRTFSFADAANYRKLQESEAKLAPIANATNPDLREFERRGGKLIQYHGWSDQLISPQNSINYYESVVTLFGAADDGRDAALKRVQGFYRLFMVPAMPHRTPDTDVQAALEQWVEHGVAPDSLMHGSGQGARLLCVHPQVAAYKGRDSRNGSRMFKCESRPDK